VEVNALSPWFIAGALLSASATNVNPWYGLGVVVIGVVAVALGGEDMTEFVIGAVFGFVLGLLLTEDVPKKAVEVLTQQLS
jgi:branched-subunit amino acid ABC-type transport system permease component